MTHSTKAATTKSSTPLNVQTTVHTQSNVNYLSFLTPLTSAISSSYIYKQINILDNTLSSFTNTSELIVLINTLVAALLISAVLLYAYKGAIQIKQSGGLSSSSRILLLGPTQSGKTLLFHLLHHNRILDTVTSTQPNIHKFVPRQLKTDDSTQLNAYQFIDIPGHPTFKSTQQQYLSQSVRGILYVIDTKYNTSDAQIQYIANDLLSVMSNSALLKQHVPVLLIVNEHSDSNIKPDVLIRNIESVIETNRHLDSGMSDISDSKQTSNKPFKLGKDTPFTFDDSQLPVFVRYGNLKQKDISAVTKFLSRI